MLIFSVSFRHIFKEEIERMVNDAEKFKDEDNKLKNRISAKNGMENNCFNIKTTTEEEKVADKTARTATKPSSGWMLNSSQR